MSDFRIMENWLFNETVTATGSTEDSGFPASNLNNFLRAKVWKSNAAGQFIIDATNDKLDFDEGSGELTATIPSATYTSTTLAAELKTQLDAAGTDTYTVAFNVTTGLWTISSDGTALSLLWDTGTNTATSIGDSLGYDTASDDTGSLSYGSASASIHTEESVLIDLQSIEEVDAFAIVFDPKRGNKLSTLAEVRIQANATPSFSSPAVDEVVTFDSVAGVYNFFWDTAQSYRYWRVKVVDPTNSNLQVELGKVVLSRSITFTQPPENGFTLAHQDLSKNQTNPFGNVFSDIYPVRRALSFNYKFLEQTDLEDLFDLYYRVGNTTPISIVLDADETIFDAQRYFFYGTLQGSLTQNHVIRSLNDTSLTLRELF